MDSNWFWWAVAAALFALEALVPGTFMLWLGFAAVATALLHLLLPGLDPTWQWFLFSLLCLISVAAGWQWRRTHPPRALRARAGRHQRARLHESARPVGPRAGGRNLSPGVAESGLPGADGEPHIGEAAG